MFLISIHEERFELQLLDSPAAREFEALLPLTIEMKHVNSNEVYATLGTRFTSEDKKAGQIYAGDLKLWNGEGLVLFYHDFPSQYAYTDLGTVVNVKGLAQALSHSSRVTFMKV
ncbi:cyclophilin-like fold protein [Streptococcus himalayensis]|uniref:Cyclophilin-like domain-containing protein n=1 Tax=Streptococcus himalayensis TaxID=1888195 RepID=A0A917A7R3_9STRE|nr:cyclophilin-like fold protein [Streptococcus himalayensis]GGE33345.1 hypothetical protein GCM10011510_13400 [Streptococcus himalayensis]